MERMHAEHLRSMPYSTLEHRHRYEVAAALAHGQVLDVACGVGYGAEFFSKNSRVTSYVGVDNAAAAIEEARSTYAGEHRAFETGVINSLRFAEGFFDTVVCLETLEHVQNPDDAVKELRRVLTRDGILVGSVPDGTFDTYVSSLFGDNPFHHWRFSPDQLHGILSEQFEYVAIGYAALTVMSVIGPSRVLDALPRTPALSSIDYQGPSYGSYYFVASNGKLPEIPSDFALGLPFFQEYCEMHHRIQAKNREIADLKEQLQQRSHQIEQASSPRADQNDS